MRSNFEREIELQTSSVLKFKYYRALRIVKEIDAEAH